MTCLLIPDVGPALRKESLRQQSRHARRREREASHALGGGRRAPARGTYYRWYVVVLLAALALAQVRRTRRREPTPVMHRLTTVEDLRFAERCHEITRERQGVAQ